MATEELDTQDSQMQVETNEGETKAKKRPRIDLTVEPRERKRGKTMFGLLVGTLNKAKNEDQARSASDAAKKRQQIEQRLTDKLRKETDSVRRAEEAKREKTSANRKEEELQLKDSIHKLRRTRLPLLANFLSTSDHIPLDDTPPPPTNPLAQPPRQHPPPVYYLPAKLLPSQEAFLARRVAEVKEAAEKEWETFRAERTAGVEEITELRQRVAAEDARRKAERKERPPEDTDVQMKAEGEKATPAEGEGEKNGDAAKMEVDDDATASPDDHKKDEAGKKQDGASAETKEQVKALASAPAPADDDDAVEY